MTPLSVTAHRSFDTPPSIPVTPLRISRWSRPPALVRPPPAAEGAMPFAQYFGASTMAERGVADARAATDFRNRTPAPTLHLESAAP